MSFLRLAETEIIRWLVRVRIVVAALGEGASPPWWRTQFLTDVGLRTARRVFPRTALACALNSVSIAARADHDRRIGVGGRYHLFRLPSAVEHRIAGEVGEESLGAEIGSLIANGRVDGLIQTLTDASNGRHVVGADGPVNLGSISRVVEKSNVEELAAYYHSSIESGRRVFPYFEDVEIRA